MHGSLKQNKMLLESVKSNLLGIGCEVAVFAPYPYLPQLQSLLSGSDLAWGAQTLSGETDDDVAKKFVAAQRSGLVPLLCLGESLAERERGATDEVVLRQLFAVLDRVGVEALSASVLAYEPVWAIGTGVTASPDQAQCVHAAIRAQISMLDSGVAGSLRILYGGSVKSQNAAELFAQSDIDGGLVGGAALVADEFLAICRAAN